MPHAPRLLAVHMPAGAVLPLRVCRPAGCAAADLLSTRGGPATWVGAAQERGQGWPQVGRAAALLPSRLACSRLRPKGKQVARGKGASRPIFRAKNATDPPPAAPPTTPAAPARTGARAATPSPAATPSAAGRRPRRTTPQRSRCAGARASSKPRASNWHFEARPREQAGRCCLSWLRRATQLLSRNATATRRPGWGALVFAGAGYSQGLLRSNTASKCRLPGAFPPDAPSINLRKTTHRSRCLMMLATM